MNDVCGLNPSDRPFAGDVTFGFTAPNNLVGGTFAREKAGGNSDLLLGHSAATVAGGNFLSEPLGGSLFGQGFNSVVSVPTGSLGMDNTWSATASSPTMNPSSLSSNTLTSSMNAGNTDGNGTATSSIAPPTTALDSYYAN